MQLRFILAHHPLVRAFCRHFSTEEFPEDLKLQTKALSSRTMGKNDMPLSVLYVCVACELAGVYCQSGVGGLGSVPKIVCTRY